MANWAHEIAFDSHGVRTGIRTTDAAIWPRLLERLPPDATPTPLAGGGHFFSVAGRDGEAAQWTLYDGPAAVIHSGDADDLLNFIEARMRMHVATWSPNRLFVHAGAVSWQGRAIVIPGVSRSGKSELVLALARAGATYYSDEYAVLNEDGLVEPYARPLALRNADGDTKRRVSPAAFGCTVGTTAVPIGAVIATRFSPDAEWRPRAISPAAAMLAMMANTVRARMDPPAAVRILSRAVARARAFESDRGEAARAADAILEHVSNSAPQDVAISAA